MIRFLLFTGFLVALAYGMTTPPEPQMAFGAKEDPAPNDKPLLTSWGPTLGSLRDGVGRPQKTGDAVTQTASSEDFHKYGPKTELWVLGQSNGFKNPADPAAKNQGWSADGYVETAGLAADKPNAAAEEQVKTKKTPSFTTIATADTRNARAKPTARSAAPVVDRIAAARPPQRRGLFSRTSTPQRVPTARARTTSRNAQAAIRNRGLFARLKGRSKAQQRAWALGPAR